MPERAPSSLPPLAGTRVLDLSRVLAGPYAGRLLCELGADVVKIEPPRGDEIRDVADRDDRGMSGLYTWANVGKRNLCIDLQKPEGRGLVLGLARHSEIVIENFRPGVADRLGVGWRDVHAANPRAVMVSVSGFGADSSWRERRAFAPVLHAATGILEDQARRSGQPLTQIVHAYGDAVTALQATIALLAALHAARRDGVGQHVEVAMFDAVLGSYTDTSFALFDPPRTRDTGPIFDAGPHGQIAVAGTPQHIWRQVADRHRLADPTPEGADLATKARLRFAALEAWMAAASTREAAIERLEEAGLAAAAAVSLREALTSSLAQERGILAEVDDRRGGTRAVPRSPWRFEAVETPVRGPAPRRGEHNREVLRERLGLDDARIEALEAAGVLQAAPPDAR